LVAHERAAAADAHDDDQERRGGDTVDDRNQDQQFDGVDVGGAEDGSQGDEAIEHRRFAK
jgi:hypothetical protein